MKQFPPVPGLQFRSLYRLGKWSTTELQSQPYFEYFLGIIQKDFMSPT